MNRLRAIRRALACAAVLASGLPAVPAVADATQAPPPTVPSIQRWTPAPGRFQLGGRIVTDPALRPDAVRLAADLAADTGTPARAVVGGATPRPGDVVLRLDSAAPARPESYRIVVGHTLTAAARTRIGAVHAAQTVLQWLRQRTALPDGTAEDWPDYPVRGLMLDTAREFFPVPWLRLRIRELAYLRMDYLHLHLSDTQGFRLASDTHPEITSPQHYSKDDIRNLVAYANEYGVTIIPEIDMPGHMDAILAHHRDLVWRPGKIDLAKAASYRLMGDILREYLPLFPGPYWHIGADEYGNATDAAASARFRDYVGWAAGVVHAAGKTPIMWNDGLNYPGPLGIDPTIIIDYWARGNGAPWLGPGRTVTEDAAAGHPVINAAFTPTYFVTGGPSARFNATPETLYAWDPGRFVDGSRLPAADAARLRGSVLHVWCDVPAALTPDQIVGPLLDRLPIMAQQLWAGTDGAAGYRAFRARLHAVSVP